MNLLELNYDCLEMTLKLLPLEDQIMMTSVSVILKDVISSIWMRKYLQHGKLSLTDSTMTTMPPKALTGFVAVMCKQTEALIVKDAAVLFILTTFKWPKLRHLDAHVACGDKTKKIQFLDEQFPALENFDLTWDVKVEHFLRCHELTAPRADEAQHADSLVNEIDIHEMQLRSERNSPMADYLVYRIRELKYQLEEMTEVATQKYKLLKGINLKSIRKLKLNKFSVQNLCLFQLPQLQELHYQSVRQETPFLEKKCLREFLTHAAACVKTQVLDKTRHMPLTVHCYYSHKAVRPALQTAETEMLHITWIYLPSPENDRYCKRMKPFYFGHRNF